MEKKQSSVEWFIEETFNLSVKFERQEISQDEYTLGYSNLLQQAKAMHKEEQNNKINLAINEFERLKSKAESIRDIIYLDGVLAVLDSIKNETFGGKE